MLHGIMRRAASAERRAGAQAARAGEEIVRAQSVLGFTDRQVARRAGVAASTVGRIRAGDGRVQLNTLCAVAEAVGLDLTLNAYIGRQPTLRDTGQLAIAIVLRGLAQATWQSALEVAAGDHGRSADVVLFGPGEILHVEIERRLVDFQLQYRSAVRKREALAAAHARPVRLVMVVEDTQHNRRLVAGHAAAIGSALPAGSREVLSALRRGQPLGRDGLLWIRRRATGGPILGMMRSVSGRQRV